MIAAWAGLAVVVAVLLYAVVCDIRGRFIPDLCAVVFVVLWLVELPWGAAPWWLTALWHVLSGVVVFVGGFFLFHAGGVGGGDVKLLAAMALWGGPSGTAQLLVATALAGGVLAVAVVVNAWRVGGWPSRVVRRGLTLPYAPAIAVGGMYVALLRYG